MRQRLWWFFSLLGLGLGLICVSVSVTVYAEQSTNTTDNRIRVYFSPQGGCENAILKAISQANKTVDVAMYTFTSQPLAAALAEAENRRIEVRVYLDKSQKNGKYSQAANLAAAGCEVKFEDSSGLMHNKFCVIDSRLLITGSYNWTKAAETKNDENLLMIPDKSLAEIFEGKFEEYWK